jgi:hypothetical protein
VIRGDSILDLQDIIFEAIDYEELSEEQWQEFTQFHAVTR